MTRQVTCVVIGAGSRGAGYAQFAKESPNRLKVVGVAEPRDFFRERMKKDHDLKDEYVVDDWPALLEKGKLADFALIATPDRLHKEPAIAFAKQGYHILLEKPMAVTAEDCQLIVDVCNTHGVMLAVCHVLRYLPESKKIKEVIDSGIIGDVVNIRHLEPIGFWHYAHSFVRGNWRNEATSCFSLLAKSCHDIDLITYWIGDKKCTNIQSFGSLNHFTQKNKPDGASSRCLDCNVEEQCPYSAKKIYLDLFNKGHRGWPIDVVTEGVPDIESLTECLRVGPYGRCVYDCDNDVVDNQVVNFQFEGGATASFSMIAFTEEVCKRKVTIYGTKGEINCNFGDPAINVFDFLTRQNTKHFLEKTIPPNTSMMGHSGADYHLINSFVTALSENDASKILTGPTDTLKSHMLVFAAEKSRKEGKVIPLLQ